MLRVLGLGEKVEDAEPPMQEPELLTSPRRASGRTRNSIVNFGALFQAQQTPDAAAVPPPPPARQETPASPSWWARKFSISDIPDEDDEPEPESVASDEQPSEGGGVLTAIVAAPSVAVNTLVGLVTWRTAAAPSEPKRLPRPTSILVAPAPSEAVPADFGGVNALVKSLSGGLLGGEEKAPPQASARRSVQWAPEATTQPAAPTKEKHSLGFHRARSNTFWDQLMRFRRGSSVDLSSEEL
jgi:hypothetical protein